MGITKIKTIEEICDYYNISQKAAMELFNRKEKNITFVRVKRGKIFKDTYYINHKLKVFERTFK